MVRRARLQSSGTEPGSHGAARQDVARHVRRTDARPCHRAGQTAVAAGSVVHAEDILCRLRLGGRGSGPENGRAVLVCQRAKGFVAEYLRQEAELRHHPQRLSRRYVECHVGVRSGDGDALAVRLGTARAVFRSAAPLAFRRRMESGRYPPATGNHRTACRRAGRPDTGTRGAGCRRHVVLSSAVSARSGKAMPRTRSAAYLR